MSSLRIEDIEPRTLHALQRLARSHGRSLQDELRIILDRAAEMAPPEAEAPALDLVTVQTGREASWSRDAIYGGDGR